MKNTILIFTILLGLASCQSKDTKGNTSVTQSIDTNLIEVSRHDWRQGFTDTVKVDKADYRVIQHLNTLHQQSYQTYFDVNKQGRIFNLELSVKPLSKRRINLTKKQWKQLEYALFRVPRYSLKALKQIKGIGLNLDYFDHNISLHIPLFEKLESVRLRNISLKEIHFHPKNTIITLHAINCDLHSLDAILTENAKMQDIWLHSNKISNIRIDTTKFKLLKNIDLAGNPIVPYLDSVRKRYPSIRFFPLKEQDEAVL